MLEAVIFDLDGVITHTAHFHYLSWKTIAEKLGFQLTEAHNAKLKGVSRVDSLKAILDWSQSNISESSFEELLVEKNNIYLQHVDKMSNADTLPGVLDMLNSLKEQNIYIALGSASKNAKAILNKLELTPYFNAISDGTNVKKSKPNPEVFLKAAEYLNIPPSNCLVVEDSQAGVEAAIKANMPSVGIIEDGPLENATLQVQNLVGLDVETLIEIHNSYNS